MLGRDEADAQLVAKVGRSVLYKDAGPKMHLTRLSEVEHEAYISLLAERAEVRVPAGRGRRRRRARARRCS